MERQINYQGKVISTNDIPKHLSEQKYIDLVKNHKKYKSDFKKTKLIIQIK